MAIVKTVLAASPYLLRYSFDFDGLNPESITVTNAEILADLGAQLGTPLRTFFNISGLTNLECHARFNSSEFAIYQRVEQLPSPSAASFPGFSQNIEVDGAGAPQLVVDFPIKDTQIIAIIDLMYRHTYDR